MHPQISHFQNFKFYDGRVENGPNVTADKYTTNFIEMPYCFIDVPYGREDNKKVGSRGPNYGSSWGNAAEVEVVRSLVKVVKFGASRGANARNLGGIS